MPDAGFDIQEALARNDRRALARLAPCSCDEDDYDFTDPCPAKVWNGCRGLDWEEDWEEMDSWPLGASDPVWELEQYRDLYDRDSDFPDGDALAEHAAEISRQSPAGWEACWKPPLVISSEASDRVLVVAIANTTDLHVSVASTDRATMYEERDPIKLPPRAYFTPEWILRILTPLFLKYHP